MAEGARKTVYEALLPIPELGVEPGDLITVRPGHPDNPLMVIRRHHRSRLPLLLDHLDHLTPLALSDNRAPHRRRADSYPDPVGEPDAP